MGVHSAKGAGNPTPSPKRTSRSRACILALDYGRRRIGLAICDSLQLAARPLATLERKGAETLTRLREIAGRHDVERIIVGHPLRMNGTRGEMAEEAARFARRVEMALALPVELVDERLTSWSARHWLAEHPEAGRGRTEDEIAAAILLDEFLDRTRIGGD